VREQDVVKLLNAEHGTDVDPEAVANYKAELFEKIIPQVSEILQVECPRSLETFRRVTY
jgi:hypothetical protein